MDVKESFQQRFEQALASSDLKPSELAEKTGISQATISQYRSGYSKPKQPRLMKLATALGVSPVWLMGLDVSMHDTNQESSIPDYSNIFPLQRKRVPLLGEIACGEPIFCNEGRESYVEAGTDVRADFCLKARGDSMIGARILDGDVVFIQRDVELVSGQIYAVAIDDEATLKRVYYDEAAQVLQLLSENPKYPPMIYSGERLAHVHVLGKAIAFQSDVI
nr:MAG TPA: Repressor protein CI [Caudoviricetes sp.]